MTKIYFGSYPASVGIHWLSSMITALSGPGEGWDILMSDEGWEILIAELWFKISQPSLNIKISQQLHVPEFARALQGTRTAQLKFLTSRLLLKFLNNCISLEVHGPYISLEIDVVSFLVAQFPSQNYRRNWATILVMVSSLLAGQWSTDLLFGTYTLG